MKYAPLLTLAAVCMILLIVTGCGKGLPVRISNFCDISQPVYVHEDDTEGTKDQVDENNIAFLRLCEAEKGGVVK